jgi:hypothetical protein
VCDDADDDSVTTTTVMVDEFWTPADVDFYFSMTISLVDSSNVSDWTTMIDAVDSILW